MDHALQPIRRIGQPFRRHSPERALWAHRLGDRIRRRRQYLGFSRRELARLAGLCESSVEAYEVGRNIPPPEALAKICAAMGEPLEEGINV